MTIWLLAILVGLAAAALQYGARALDLRVAPLAALRALAVALVVALLLGAPGGRSTPLVPPSTARPAWGQHVSASATRFVSFYRRRRPRITRRASVPSPIARRDRDIPSS